jgi:hypothetical protein
MAIKKTAPTPEDFLSEFPSDIQMLANDLRALIREGAPDRIEAVYPGWALLGYRIPVGRKSAYWGFVHPTREYVTIGFEWGLLLSDPNDLLEGDDLKQVRFITLRPGDAIPHAAITAWIVEAGEVASLPGEVRRQRILEWEELRRLG